MSLGNLTESPRAIGQVAQRATLPAKVDQAPTFTFKRHACSSGSV
jgi:hypothetical protein